MTTPATQHLSIDLADDPGGTTLHVTVHGAKGSYDLLVWASEQTQPSDGGGIPYLNLDLHDPADQTLQTKTWGNGTEMKKLPESILAGRLVGEAACFTSVFVPTAS